MKSIYNLLIFTIVTLSGFSQTLVTVEGGSSIVINSGSSFTNADIILKSESDSFSNLILDGTLGATPAAVNYDRFVNLIGSGPQGNGGNDLVSAPVFDSGVTISTFLTYGENLDDNKNTIANNPSNVTEFAFGPWDNNAGAYVNYDSNGTDELAQGIGYRAATELDSDGIVRFIGSVLSSDLTNIAISNFGTSISRWNLVGNPYPSYINSQSFLAENSDSVSANSAIDPNTAAIYGYTDGTFTGTGKFGNFIIINSLVNTDVNIAPGQGFFIRDNPDNSLDLAFTTSMRTIDGTDDFIAGRNASETTMLRLKAEGNDRDYATEFYFNDISTPSLDVGSDATTYFLETTNFVLYSNLVEDNLGEGFSIQALPNLALEDVTIPLGLRSAQGEQITFSIESSTIPNDVNVYLEDNLTNTFTLLNSGNYIVTPNQPIDGTGRFFLHFGNETLDTNELTASGLQLYSVEKTIFVKGQLLDNTKLNVYDLQGRLVLSDTLDAGLSNYELDASSLSTNIYIVTLSNGQQEETKKLIIE